MNLRKMVLVNIIDLQVKFYKILKKYKFHILHNIKNRLLLSFLDVSLYHIIYCQKNIIYHIANIIYIK